MLAVPDRDDRRSTAGDALAIWISSTVRRGVAVQASAPANVHRSHRSVWPVVRSCRCVEVDALVGLWRMRRVPGDDRCDVARRVVPL